MDLMEWLQGITAAGALSAVAIAAAAYLKTRPAMKTALVQGEAALWTRIGELEAKLDTERNDCDRRIDGLHDTIVALEAQIQTLRHDRNNIRQGLNAMMAMLKQEGAEVTKVVAAVEDMMARGDEVIALEKGAMKRRDK